jgi:hypothetical protein
MKISNKLLSIFVILTIALCIFAFISPFVTFYCSKDTILADTGNQKTVKKELPKFSRILITGIYKVKIVNGRRNSIAITAEENVIPHVKYKVDNGELIIYARSDMKFGKDGKSVKIEKIAPLKDIRIDIVTKTLKGIRCNGMCSFKVDNIKSKDFYIKFNGLSTLNINGKVKNLNIDSKGFGRIYADELQAKNVEIDLEGVSRATVWATDKLSVDMKGWNYLNYKGKPKNIIPVIKGYGKITESKSGKPVKNWFGLWIDDNITIDRDKNK